MKEDNRTDDIDFIDLFSKELDIPFSYWRQDKDLIYIADCARKFTNDSTGYYENIYEIIAPRLSTDTVKKRLETSLLAIYDKWQNHKVPSEVIAQAFEVAANDIRLIDQMRQDNCDISVTDELERTLSDDSIQVGIRLKRNAFRKIQTIRVITANQTVLTRKVTSLKDRCKELPLQIVEKKHRHCGFNSVIITGGRSTRVRTTIPKGIIYLDGKPMIHYTINAARKAGANDIIAVVGFKKDINRKVIGKEIAYAEQAEVLGTGHAVMQAKSLLFGYEGTLLISYSDMPFIKDETLKQLIGAQQDKASAMTILTTTFEKRPEFGRLVYSKEGSLLRISQPRHEEIESNEVDAGFYCLKCPDLWEYLGNTNDDNNRGEYYLTDVVGIISEAVEAMSTFCTYDEEETMGINRPHELIVAECILYCRSHCRGKQVSIDNKVINEKSYYQGKFFEKYGGRNIEDFIESFPSAATANAGLETLTEKYTRLLNNNVGAIFWLRE